MIGIGIVINNINQRESIKVNSSSNEPSIVSERILVQVSGEVIRPGIYEVDLETRVNEVINLCGGFTNNADVSNINLVAKVNDGMIIMINPKNKIDTLNQDKNLISINTAGVSELIQLDGIGEAKARNIISYRELNGRFTDIEELLNVTGISKTILANIKDHICL